MRVLLSIPSLMPGGAERQLVALANGLHRRGHRVRVVALGSGGPLATELDGPDLDVLGKRSRLDNLRVLRELARLVRTSRPQAHYGFLTAPNILGAMLRPLFPRVPLVMGVRASAVDFSQYDYGRAGRLATRLEARLACLAQAVVVNSQAGLTLCLERGYPKDRCVVIPNGIDTRRFRLDRASGATLRANWGASATDILVGLPARLDPIKDHPTFLQAAALLARQRPDLRFVCIGGGPEATLIPLKRLGDELGLDGRLVWAGGIANMTAAYNALDLVCLCSQSEGFPNVLGEAMACGVPCVSTEVGDAALVLGDTGEFAPPGEPEALAAAILRQMNRLDREGDELRTRCGQRVVQQFSLERMVADTEALLLRLAAGPGGRG